MSSKASILSAIRRHEVPEAALPDLNGDWIRYPDKAARFAEVLSFVGGKPLRAANRGELEAMVRALPQLAEARHIVCTVPGLEAAAPATAVRIDPAAVAKPVDLENIDVAIVAGEFAVAENAAVWVTETPVTHRAVYFLAQHVVLVVPTRELIDNLHEAYARVSFARAGYGLFISGPSKTADIEQSLVIGAHGPRSLTVVLVEEP
jgi:L-lactate dehydrogenase complex protein LldG